MRRRSGRPADAARLLLLYVGDELRSPLRLDPAKRRAVLTAAEDYEASHRPLWAFELYRAVGAQTELAALVHRAGIPIERSSAPVDLLPVARDAAGFAVALGEPVLGASLLESLGALAEAALAYLAGGDKSRCLQVLIRIPASDQGYRPACVRVVALARELDSMGVVLEQFLARFIETGPLSSLELQSFYDLGVLYEKHGLRGNAEEAFRKLVRIRPDFQDAAAMLERVKSARHGPTPGARTILSEEASFHGRRALAGGARPARAKAETTVTPLSTGSTGPVIPFHPGALVADRYRLGPQIGRGGMSLVFDAQDIEMAEAVAIKVFIHPVEGEELLARFRREMQVSRQLAHRNVLRLHDLGAFLGYRFVSMERLHGADLRQRLTERLPLSQVVDILIQTFDGLEAAHAQGVIHRDLKPENLFVTDDGVVKVMDFGIAKVMSAPNVTLSGVIWGTPRYMSPEQISSFSSVEASSDLYSMAVVGYEMLLGHPPFDHPELTELLMMHLRQTPLSPREVRPEIPEALEALLLEMLAKDPSQRPASAGACVERLRDIESLLPES